MRQMKLEHKGIEEVVLLPETREEYEAAMQSRARTVVITVEQKREWGVAADTIPLSEADAVRAIFGSDQDFYETLLEEDAGESPPVEELEADPDDVLVVTGTAHDPAAAARSTAGQPAALAE